MVGQTGDKNLHFKKKTDMCVDAWAGVMCCNSELGSTGMLL